MMGLGDDNEEEKGTGSPNQLRTKRTRTKSINGMKLVNTVGKSNVSPNLFASLSAAIGGEDEDTRQYRLEARNRGVSDVDDTNIRQLQDNTSNMIQT